MKRILLALLFSAIFHTFSLAQCFNPSLVNQSMVDNFPTLECTDAGNIWISGADILNIDSLYPLISIEHLKIFSYANLTNFDGLYNLEIIEDEFELEGDDINNVLGLTSLVEVTGVFNIGSNTNVTSLEGLNSLETVGEFSLNGGPLSDVSSLQSLSTVGTLILNNFNTLEYFSFLTNLTTIDQDLRINGSENLLSLRGLENITHIEGDLIINASEGLACLKGLDGLVSIGGDLVITNNDFLLSMAGLENLTSVGGVIRIENNPFLTYCNQTYLCNLIDGTSIISNNDPGCNDINELNSNCTTPDALPDNITLTTQGHMNEFAAMFPGYQNIVGNLNFELEENTTSLAGLSQIQTVGGDFTMIEASTIVDNLMQDLDGLENLSSVGGDFLIQSIYDLASLEALTSLVEVGGGFKLGSMDSIQNLAGLENLQSIGGLLEINGCRKITDISALANLNSVDAIKFIELKELESLNGLNITEIPSYFHLVECNALTNFEGLEQLESIGDRFNLYENDNIINFQGLQNLSKIGENFLVERNKNFENFSGFSVLDTIGGDFVMNGFLSTDSLKNFHGMESLKYIGGQLRVRNNENLTTLFGLHNVEVIAGGMVDFYYNQSLSNCAIPSVCNVLSDNSNLWIFGDSAPGCNSANQVLNVCNDSISKVSGMTFIDFDCNQIYDQTDTRFPYHLIKRNNQPTVFTNDTAAYENFLNPNATTLISAGNLSGFSVYPEFHTITTSTNVVDYSNTDFGFCPDSSFTNFSVYLTDITPPRPGFSNQYQIDVMNRGTQNGNVILDFDWSNNPTGDDATILSAGGGIINGNTIQWQLNDLLPFVPIQIIIETEMDPTTVLGTILNPRAQVQSTSGTETTLLDNVDMLNQEVVGSYDPNDKTVDKEELITEGFIDNEELEYLIRFQNTGTFPATFIEVLDTFQTNLDMSTFKMIAASHSYTLTFPQENVIKWRFDDINLPDSTSNEPESHGFIKFNINTIDGLTINDSIINRAGIYFDFNAPIITNYATTNIDLPLNIQALDHIYPLNIYPNPASNTVNIQFNFPGENRLPSSILITDLSGKIVSNINREIDTSAEQVIEIPVNNLGNGIYFIQVQTSKYIAIGKVSILKN